DQWRRSAGRRHPVQGISLLTRRGGVQSWTDRLVTSRPGRLCPCGPPSCETCSHGCAAATAPPPMSCCAAATSGWRRWPAAAPAAGLGRSADLHEAARRLPAESREVFALRFYHGRTFAEIAAILAVSGATARRRWLEAVAELAGQLRELPD